MAKQPRYTRRKGDDRLTETTSVKFPASLIDALSVHALRTGQFNSDLIREGVMRLLRAEAPELLASAELGGTDGESKQEVG